MFIMKNNLFWILPVVVMGIGIFDMPYGYYNLVRFTVSFCAVYFVYLCFVSAKSDSFVLWVFVAISLLYNPFFQIHLYEKSIWVIVNLVTAYAFLANRNLMEQKDD